MVLSRNYTNTLLPNRPKGWSILIHEYTVSVNNLSIHNLLNLIDPLQLFIQVCDNFKLKRPISTIFYSTKLAVLCRSFMKRKKHSKPTLEEGCLIILPPFQIIRYLSFQDT
jgi:hypothetical protein